MDRSRLVPLALATLATLCAPALLPLAAAEEESLLAAYNAIKTALKNGDVAAAESTYATTFQAGTAARDASLDARINGAFHEAEAAEPAGLAYTIARQTVDKGLLQSAAMNTAHLAEQVDAEAAEAWFAILGSKFGTAVAESERAVEALAAGTVSGGEARRAIAAELDLVFAGKVKEEIQEALGNLAADPPKAQEQAWEAIVYYYAIQAAAGERLGAGEEAELFGALETFFAEVQEGEADAARDVGGRALFLLSKFDGTALGDGDAGIAATDFVNAVAALVAEYNEYVRDGVVVDQARYDAEVVALFLPAAKAAYAELKPHLAARSPAAAAGIGGDLALLEQRVLALATHAEVSALAEAIRRDVEAVIALSPTAAPAAGNAIAAVNAVEAKLEQALAEYRSGDASAALATLASAYLDVYAVQVEPFVPAGLNAEIESLINVQIRDAIQRGAPAAEVALLVAQAQGKLDAAAQAIAAPRAAGKTLFDSFLIIAREGFEAILVVGAVVAYLIRFGHTEKTRQIYLGAGLGIAASLLLWALVSSVLTLSGEHRELLEGITALIAVVVLFYVATWMIDKVQIGRWNRFIQGKVRSALTEGRPFALIGVAFLAVFREGLETVLFYQALFVSAAGQEALVLLGFVAGLAVLVVVFVAFYKYGVKIPMRPFFVFTSLLLFYLAFSFAGTGVHELQEAGSVGTTLVPPLAEPLGPGTPASLLGLYPTVETLTAQALLTLGMLLFAAWSFVVKPRYEARAEAAEA